MSFKDQMQDAKILLTKLGHDVLFTPGDEDLEGAPLPPISEKASRKVALDVFALYHGYIQKADAVLCYNETKGSVPHYIGANSFLELGFAAALHKKMYLLYPIPDMPYLREELVAMNPYILYGRLENIGADI
jgi:hypothetical protein